MQSFSYNQYIVKLKLRTEFSKSTTRKGRQGNEQTKKARPANEQTKERFFD